MIKRTLLLILLSISLILSGCSKTNPQTEQEKIQSAFDDFTNSVFLDTVTSNTINLHFTLAYPEKYGLTDTMVTLGDYGKDFFMEEYARTETMLNDLLKFNYELLTPTQQLTYDILEDALNSELAGNNYIFFNEALSPLTGYQAQLPILMANYTFRNKHDIEAYLLLLAGFDDFFTKIMDFQKIKSEQGYFMPDFMAEDVIEQCESFTENPENNWLVETFNSRIEEIGWLSRVVFISFWYENLTDLREILPEQPMQYLTGVRDDFDWLIPELASHGMDLDVQWGAVNEELMALCRKHGVAVNCWTVDHPDDAKRLIALGVNYITSNILE